MIMNPETHEKLGRLRSLFLEKRRVLVAFSGGVDSTVCMKIAHDVLGTDNAIAVTANSETLTPAEFEQACAIARDQGWNHRVITYSQLDDEEQARNPVNRCYLCKRDLYSRLSELARDLDCSSIIDGANYDDTSDFRPGMSAAREQGVVSPMLECGVTKREIREMAREFGLPNWNKPSGACLASRFAYGARITREGLNRVGQAEEYLRLEGFSQVRVRNHDNLARIEVPVAEIHRFISNGLWARAVQRLRELGFQYVTLDLAGYRTGSMNEILGDGQKQAAYRHAPAS